MLSAKLPLLNRNVMLLMLVFELLLIVLLAQPLLLPLLYLHRSLNRTSRLRDLEVGSEASTEASATAAGMAEVALQEGPEVLAVEEDILVFPHSLVRLRPSLLH
ncbi:hypothetical protein GUJ93_ZPchr0008g13388 [Zizania palustris]|uniref:Uncharacterized protein n=1 Tax=Zizania palustris TaxID=103762 RepID=A0A8J5V2C0_ZIZPA|nr:hypothetical protein GUJ93_ZPchr0008g13388 [Zizania palustris]